MKFYRVLDMSISKDSGTYGDDKFRVGSYGSSGGVMTSLDECVSIIEKERNSFLRGREYGEVSILKDEITEFQGKLIEVRNEETRETIYSIKIVPIDIQG